MIPVYPIETTIYDPDKTHGGYTLLNFLHEPEIVLFDMNGNVVNTWTVDRTDPTWSGIWNYANLLENGSLLGPREYDWDNHGDTEGRR